MVYPVYTETTNCRDCYKCVRTCPVKAIQVKDGNAVVVKDRCIFCGHCVEVCPNGAKKIRSDLDRARLLVKNHEHKVFCSLAPSFASEFQGHERQLLVALNRLGFDEISETAIGAAIVSTVIDRYAKTHNGQCPWISTACPSIVELIKKYYPQDVGMLAPVPSPLECHSAYLRYLYGDDIAIIFIGPCIAKKMEADMNPGYPNIALTFDELRTWLKESDIDYTSLPVTSVPEFVPSRAGKSSFYPVERGMIFTSDIWSREPITQNAVALSGMEQVLSTLDEVKADTPFLELLGCDGGCVNGPVSDHTASLALKKRAATLYTQSRMEESNLFVPDDAFIRQVEEKGYGIMHASRPVKENSYITKYPDSEITRAMHELGKYSKADELNCGGCGYNTCHDMAVAYLDGMAEIEMCVTKMRKEAQSKVDVLLRTIPMGVVIVDKELKIADCNTQFLDIFGGMEEGFVDQSLLAMIKGLPLERFVPFCDRFTEQFYVQKAEQYRVHYKDKFLRVTFFQVDKDHLVGAMFDDITNPTVRRETVVKKAEDVIQKSLETVQQIASLLGENAAETEIMLNDLIAAFSVHASSEVDSKGFSIDKQQDLT